VEGLVGTTVTVAGSGFSSGVSSVSINTVPVSTGTVSSDTQILLQVPNDAISGAITVTGTYGTATSPQAFAVTPDIVTIHPTSGHINQSVAITGSGFTGATAVTLGVLELQYTINGPNLITVTIPASAATGELVVTASGQSSTMHSNTDTFTVD